LKYALWLLACLEILPALCAQTPVPAALAAAAPAHQIVSSWTDNPANPAGDIFNVYMLQGACPAPAAAGTNPAGFTKVGSLIAAKTFTNANVTTNVYCLAVTALNASGAGESLYSPTSSVTVPAFAPTAVTAAQGANGTITLTLTDSLNGVGTTWSFYRGAGGTNGCAGASPLTKIASGLAVKGFTDSPGAGSWCYGSTATLNGIESPMSPLASAPLALLAPSAPVNAAQ
jgi:hypothetical protein